MKPLYMVLYLFFLAVFFCNVTVEAQLSTPEFTLGSFLSYNPSQSILDSFDSSGMNTVVWKAYSSTKDYLSKYNVIASNQTTEQDWISFYSTAYYSKWESEENQEDIERMGVKHKYGKDTVWKGIACWSTKGINVPRDSIVYGPHYRQDRRYKRWLFGDPYDVNYTVRFNLALDFNPQLVNPGDTVCIIKAVFRYAEIYSPTSWQLFDTVFSSVVLRYSNFNQDGTFKVQALQETYKYPIKFHYDKMDLSWDAPPRAIKYDDSNPDNGIQFCVDWLTDDTNSTLYIDYAEVYDNYGWDQYISNPNQVISRITSYSNSYSDWSNIKYWFGPDEPFSLDACIPYRTVDQILNSIGGKPLITEFQPPWHPINGEFYMGQFFNMAQPNKFMIDPYYFGPAGNVPQDLDSLKSRYSEAESLQPGFWVVAQGFGQKINDTGEWLVWRRPNSAELKANVMLALAYGSKGIMFWNYDSYAKTDSTWFHCIAYDDSVSDLYYLIKNNLAPRLKGMLGNKLLNLDYTRKFLSLKYFDPTDNYAAVTEDYLTLGLTPSANTMQWHAGLFNRQLNTEDKYFFLVNLLTTLDKQTDVRITPPVQGYSNYRFRDIEGSFDTTFTSEFITNLSHSKGEGKLYQVAPVIKYGGNLIYNDSVKSSGTELIDNMTIKNGVTLSIQKDLTYTVKDTITLEGAGFISGQGYLNLSQGTINTVSWSKSLFKGLNGTHPRLYIRKPLTESTPATYTVYRQSGTTGFISLGNLGGTATEFIDSTIDVTTANPITDYYLIASFSGFAVNTNIVRYDRTSGNTDTLYLPSGWQTVSVPVIMTDSSAMTVLGTSQVYKFSGGYHQVTTLDNGVGYWANFPTGPDTIVFNGTPVDSLAMPVDSGWNLKGSLFYNLFVSQVRAVPETIIQSIYKYVNGYVALNDTSILKPGIGYWIKTNDSGTVYMEANFGKITSVLNVDFAIMDKFTLQDAEGNQQILYVTNTDLDSNSIDVDFEMPPYYSELPFDSRFEMSDLVKKVSASSGTVNLDILVHSLSYPVTISWELNPANCINYSFIGDSTLGKMTGLGKAAFSNLKDGKISLTAYVNKDAYNSLVPSEFELLQNYPNPFNPNTRIKYSIAKESQVNLTVYNILGQKVTELINETKKPGYYEVNFDASSISSGIYLYTLQAGDFVDTKKMMVIK